MTANLLNIPIGHLVNRMQVMDFLLCSILIWHGWQTTGAWILSHPFVNRRKHMVFTFLYMWQEWKIFRFLNFLDQNTTTVRCAPVCRSSNNKGHRYTVDGPYCPSGGMTIERMNIGYTPTFFVPGLTDIVYEVLNPTNGFMIMTYNSSGLDFVTTLGYNSVQRIIYVSTIPSDSASLFYHFYDKPKPKDSIITKDIAEYNQLVNLGWELIATYYMYDSQSSNGECSLAQSIYSLNCRRIHMRYSW